MSKKKFNTELLKKLDQQQEYIEKRLEEQSELLKDTASNKTIGEKEQKNSYQEDTKQKFWFRLFGKNKFCI